MSQSDWVKYDKTPRSDFVLWWQVVRLAFQDLFKHAPYLIPVNLLAMVLSPIIVFTPPLLGALWWAAKHIARNETITFRSILTAGRDNALQAWRVTLINAFVYSIVFLGLFLYSSGEAALPFEASPNFYATITAIFLVVGVLWSVAMLFSNGWIALSGAKPPAALRKAAQLLMEHYVFALLMIILIILIVLFHFILWPAVLLFTWALLALLSVRSVQVLTNGVPHDISAEEKEASTKKRRKNKRRQSRN